VSMPSISSAMAEIHSLDMRKAELMFSIAVVSAKSGHMHMAEGFAREALELLNRMVCRSYEDCATGDISILGVLLPEFFHEGTVRERLSLLNIKLN